jgi:AcrR family transcriptional regulator
MARTRSAHYPENQARILETAARLFAARGFARVSIAALAAACQCSKALLYHYYPSKEALLYTLLRSHLETLRTVTEQALATSTDPEVQFRALVRANMTIYARSRDKHIVLMNDLHCLPPAQRQDIRLVERRLTTLVADLLTRMRPELRQDTRLRMPYAMMFYGMLNWTYIWYDDHGPVGPEEFARRAADLFLHGFKPRPDGAQA